MDMEEPIAIEGVIVQEMDEESLAQTCTPKERAFAEQYVIDLNGTQAIQRTGCYKITTQESARVCASRLFARANVSALISILRAQRAAAVGITQEIILNEMSLLALSDVTHYFIDDNGDVKLKPGAPEGATRAIQSVKRKKIIKQDKDGAISISYEVELKLQDKPTPLRLLGRHVGLFPDKIEITGKDGGPLSIQNLSDAELAARIERMTAETKAILAISEEIKE